MRSATTTSSPRRRGSSSPNAARSCSSATSAATRPIRASWTHWGETMIPRYTRPAMGRIWTDEARYAHWLEIEALACEALAARGALPKSAVRTIRRRAKIDVARIAAIEAEVKHDVIAFVTQVAESVGPEGRFLHVGLTSSD